MRHFSWGNLAEPRPKPATAHDCQAVRKDFRGDCDDRRFRDGITVVPQKSGFPSPGTFSLHVVRAGSPCPHAAARLLRHNRGGCVRCPGVLLGAQASDERVEHGLACGEDDVIRSLSSLGQQRSFLIAARARTLAAGSPDTRMGAVCRHDPAARFTRSASLAVKARPSVAGPLSCLLSWPGLKCPSVLYLTSCSRCRGQGAVQRRYVQ